MITPHASLSFCEPMIEQLPNTAPNEYHLHSRPLLEYSRKPYTNNMLYLLKEHKLMHADNPSFISIAYTEWPYNARAHYYK